jgi:hypothetical protein
MVEDQDIYERVFPSEMGFDEYAKRRPVEYRPGDKLPYIEVTMSDQIKLRKISRMPWSDDFILESN